MKYEEVTSLLSLAGLKFSGINKMPNLYWPDHPNYDKAREESPWWAVNVEGEGVITLGWRKRVIHIDWSQTSRRGEVTGDDVTKDDQSVHAWSLIDAIKYLRAFRELPVVDLAVPGLKSHIVEGGDKVLEALRVIGDDSYEMATLTQMVEMARLGWNVVLSVSRIGDSGHSLHLRAGKLSIHYYQKP
jgi:hypothetical protein